MKEKKKLAKKYVKEKIAFDDTFKYSNDVEFLELLEEGYKKLEEYEVCQTIQSRVSILTDKKGINSLNALNNQVELYKQINLLH